MPHTVTGIVHDLTTATLNSYIATTYLEDIEQRLQDKVAADHSYDFLFVHNCTIF